jgi:hypothetical protein
MINEGKGIEEALSVFEVFTKNFGLELDFEKGILQAIGYKEYYPFYQHLNKKYPEGKWKSLVTELSSLDSED